MFTCQPPSAFFTFNSVCLEFFCFLCLDVWDEPADGRVRRARVERHRRCWCVFAMRRLVFLVRVGVIAQGAVLFLRSKFQESLICFGFNAFFFYLYIYCFCMCACTSLSHLLLPLLSLFIVCCYSRDISDRTNKKDTCAHARDDTCPRARRERVEEQSNR